MTEEKQPAIKPQILALSLRPRTLSGIFGNTSTIAAIRKQMSKRPPSTWMFHGPTGTGKTTIARIISVAYQCTHMSLWGDPCKDWWARRNDFAIHEINASNAGGVEKLGQVAELSMFKPSNPGGKRVIILDEAQRISAQAYDLLLKPLEEPPPTTVWIICTTEPNKIIQTIRRRCTIYQLKTLSITGVEEFLKKQAARVGITLPLDPLLEQCHLMQIGSPALLLQALEQYAAGVSPAEAVTGVSDTGINTLRICKAVTAGNWRVVCECLSTAVPDQSRLIRASVSGWLVGCMKKDSGGRLERIAASLIELSIPPFDDTQMLHWLYGVLWKITKRFGSS